MRVQFSASSIDNSSVGCNGSSSEGASVEILGDALAGYIVNVVREKGEEAVRIPPSISAKLKAHQVLYLVDCCFSFTHDFLNIIFLSFLVFSSYVVIYLA